jgi:hypothetical protein
MATATKYTRDRNRAPTIVESDHIPLDEIRRRFVGCHPLEVLVRSLLQILAISNPYKKTIEVRRHRRVLFEAELATHPGEWLFAF